MRKMVIALAASALSVVGFAGATAARADVTVCHDVNISVPGQAPIADAGCTTLPPAP